MRGFSVLTVVGVVAASVAQAESTARFQVPTVVMKVRANDKCSDRIKACAEDLTNRMSGEAADEFFYPMVDEALAHMDKCLIKGKEDLRRDDTPCRVDISGSAHMVQEHFNKCEKTLVFYGAPSMRYFKATRMVFRDDIGCVYDNEGADLMAYANDSDEEFKKSECDLFPPSGRPVLYKAEGKGRELNLVDAQNVDGFSTIMFPTCNGDGDIPRDAAITFEGDYIQIVKRKYPVAFWGTAAPTRAPDVPTKAPEAPTPLTKAPAPATTTAATTAPATTTAATTAPATTTAATTAPATTAPATTAPATTAPATTSAPATTKPTDPNAPKPDILPSPDTPKKYIQRCRKVKKPSKPVVATLAASTKPAGTTKPADKPETEKAPDNIDDGFVVTGPVTTTTDTRDPRNAVLPENPTGDEPSGIHKADGGFFKGIIAAFSS